MNKDRAECGDIANLLQKLGTQLDRYQRFEHTDSVQTMQAWRAQLDRPVPEEGVGIDQLMEEIAHDLIPNASQIPSPGCTAFITTGATSAGVLASLAGDVAAPQRAGITAFNFLEELSLDWMASMFELHPQMKGVYSSGGSVANLVALGAARQYAFEQIGIDPAKDGFNHHCRIYTTMATHHTVQRAAAVLGMGRRSIVIIDSDHNGRMIPASLQHHVEAETYRSLNIAVVANAGTTSTGSIDPLAEIAKIAHHYKLWFHVDGAYGLPGILDPQIHDLYSGLNQADSVIVDPHKWLGAPVGIGATYVRDRSILHRAFTQEASDYLEGSISDAEIQHSMDSLGVPYHDFGVELSAPSRGAVVWALIREIGKQGLQERVCRHNNMARWIAKSAHAHPNLEVLQEPTLSICCFRYISNQFEDLNALNRQIHRQLVHQGKNIPSTALINNKLAIRPCFIGARTSWQHAYDLFDEVIATGNTLVAEREK